MKTEAAWIYEAEMALTLDPKLTSAIIRQIQIDALRHAREVVENHPKTIYLVTDKWNRAVTEDHISREAILRVYDGQIRDLELR